MPRRSLKGRPVERERDHARPRTVPAPTTAELDAQLTPAGLPGGLRAA
jgi:hypothetical protein